MCRVRPDGLVISGQAGSGIYATPAGTSSTSAIVAMPCGQSNLAGTRVIGYQSIDGADWIVRCNVDGSDLTPLTQISCNIIVGGTDAWAWSVLGGTYTQTSWGLRLDGAVALWMTDDDSLIVLSDYAAGRGVACYPKGATTPSWSVPDAVTLTRYPYPQLYALDADRVIWCDVAGNFGTYGLVMPDAGTPYGGLVNPFILTAPDGSLWLGYEQAEQTRLRPWHDASRGYVFPTGYGQSGSGSWVCWAANGGENAATSVQVDWSAPMVSWDTPSPPTPDPDPKRTSAMTSKSFGLGYYPTVAVVNGALTLVFMRVVDHKPVGLVTVRDGVETDFMPMTGSFGFASLDAEGNLGYIDGNDQLHVLLADGTSVFIGRGYGLNPIKVGYGRVVYVTAEGIYQQPVTGGAPEYLAPLTASTGLAYLTPTGYVLWDDNRLSQYPPIINPAFANGAMVGQGNKPGMGIVATWGATGQMERGVLWNDIEVCADSPSTIAFAAWSPAEFAGQVTLWQNVSAADIASWNGGGTPSEPPTETPTAFTSLPTYEKPMFCSAFFQYSLRPSSGVTDDPFGNCATLVGSPDDPTMLGKEVAMTPGALVVVGDQPESGADLNRTVAWWVSGADVDGLGRAVAACDAAKPIAAYLDRRGWPQDKPAWVTPSVWPSVQVYRAPGESLEAFEAAVRADLERVAAYGGYCWVTLRLDDYNGAGSVAQTLEACPVYDRLIRDFPCIVGLHLFADERKGGMAFHPELRAWGKAFAGACGPRPSRYDYCTLPGVSATYTLEQKLLQDRGTYQLSAADRTYVLALMGDVEPPEPPQPPTGDLPEPPNGFWAVEAEWAIAPPDGSHDSNLDFCRRVAQRLVAAGDPRWGLNWKRGVVGDPSVDIVAYRWGPTDADARIVDILYAAEDPTQHAPTWSVHSVEDAGRVLWYPA